MRRLPRRLLIDLLGEKGEKGSFEDFIAERVLQGMATSAGLQRGQGNSLDLVSKVYLHLLSSTEYILYTTMVL